MTTALIAIILVVEIIVTPLFSRFCLRNYPKVTSDEIRELHPDLGNVAFNFFSLSIFVFLFSAIIYILAVVFFGGSGIVMIFLFGPLFLTQPFFEGIFAIKTNIYPATTSSNWDNFVYNESKSLRWIAKFQIGIAVLEIAFSIICCIIYRE
jgi:hypothetical protein